MKEFCCGDVVAGCSARFTGATNEEILAAVARHAREDHGLESVPDALVTQVVAAIRPVAA